MPRVANDPGDGWPRRATPGQGVFVDEAQVDIAVVGAGAAGLFAAMWAARSAPGARVVALDGARTLGAKILVAGGGRCNVTHERVDERDFAGSTPAAIRKVLRRFGVPETVAFFRELGVELKREETGKLFPVTDDARTVRDALVGAVRAAGARIEHPWRVGSVERGGEGFLLRREARGEEAQGVDGVGGASWPGEVVARRVVLATGGMALPRTGSDGAGYGFARALGHTTTARIFPALVPLVVAEGHYARELQGLSAPAGLEVRSATGKRLAAVAGSTLCTHFGLSGPGVLDVSRHLAESRSVDAGAGLVVNWAPGRSVEDVDALLVSGRRRAPARVLAEGLGLPERLARALCASAGVDGGSPAHDLARGARRELAGAVAAGLVPVTGDRGFAHAEVTAGGVPLEQVRLETMGSRVCEGLFLCGEICDVDGRIGGFNFQWAWASGYVAGCGAAGGVVV